MALYLRNGSRDLINLKAGLPADYNGPILKGATVSFFVKDTCNLLIQELSTELYTLRLNIFRFFERLTIESTAHKTGLHSRILLKGSLLHKIKGAGSIRLKESEFTMLWSGVADCNCRFEKDKDYRTFDIFYSPGLVAQLASVYPGLASVLESKKPSLLIKSPGRVNPAMRDIIQQILECPYDEATRQFYFDLKVREFLYLMLQQTYNPAISRYRFTAYEISCIIKAHSLLMEDLSKPPLKLRSLAKAVALNEFKLKAGFRQQYGMGIFECLHEARMDKARNLLLTTDKPLKQICVMTGYPRMTNFITSFRKKFGYTPGSLRRN